MAFERASQQACFDISALLFAASAASFVMMVAMMLPSLARTNPQ